MITDLVLIDRLNKQLAKDYRVLDGRPIYRIVWSDEQLETRWAVWDEFVGKIFIRQVSGRKQIKKYWYMNPPRWVLEKLIFIQSVAALEEMRKELPEAENGTYEPIFPFADKDGNPLPVSIPVVDRVLWALHTPLKRNPSDIEQDRRMEEAEEVKYFEEQIGSDERSPLFVWENSAFVSTNQMKFRREEHGLSLGKI